MEKTFHGFPLILWIVGGAIALEILICYIILPGIGFLRDLAQPVCRGRARVLMAHQRALTDTSTLVWLLLLLGRRRWYWPRHDAENNTPPCVYFLTFETEDNRRLEFRVSEAQFVQQAQGDTGLLVYQGNHFIDFQCDKTPGPPQMDLR